MVGGLPGCGGGPVDGPPSWHDRQAWLAEVQATSKVFDSRLELLCARYGVDAELHREALAKGHTLHFKARRFGRSVVVAVIHPDEDY